MADPSVSDAAPVLVPEGPRAFASLRHPDFRFYATTGLLSMMADNIEHVISYWMIFQAFDSPALAGFAVISHWAPFLFFGITIGALADRYDCRRLIQLAQLTYIAVSLAWAILFLTGTLQWWHAAVLLTAHGFAGAFWAPAGQLILYDIVGREDLQSAVRLNATARQLGLLFGPAVGGALLLVLGPAYGLVANCLLYLPMTLWLSRLRRTGHVRDGSDLARQPRLSLADALATMREVSRDRVVFALVLLVGATALFVGNAFQAVMPEFANALSGGANAIAYSALLAANAAGAVFGGVVLESWGVLRRPSARPAVVLGVLWSVTMLAFALTSAYPVALLALFAAGALFLAFGSLAQTVVQLEAPRDRRGRVIGLFNMSQNGLRVGSGATVGLLGGVIGIHASLALSAGVTFLVCLALLAWTGGEARAASAR